MAASSCRYFNNTALITDLLTIFLRYLHNYKSLYWKKSTLHSVINQLINKLGNQLKKKFMRVSNEVQLKFVSVREENTLAVITRFAFLEKSF